MTHDPHRDSGANPDANPSMRPYQQRQPGGNNFAVLLGVMAALVLGGILFYAMNRPASVATDGRLEARPPVTTGAGPGADTGTGMNSPAARESGPAPAPRQ